MVDRIDQAAVGITMYAWTSVSVSQLTLWLLAHKYNFAKIILALTRLLIFSLDIQKSRMCRISDLPDIWSDIQPLCYALYWIWPKPDTETDTRLDIWLINRPDTGFLAKTDIWSFPRKKIYLKVRHFQC